MRHLHDGSIIDGFDADQDSLDFGCSSDQSSHNFATGGGQSPVPTWSMVSLTTSVHSLQTMSASNTTSDEVSFAGTGIVFNNTFTANVTPAYKNCILAAEQTIASEWTNSITINLEFDAQASGTNTFAATNHFSGGGTVSYSTLKNALTALSLHEPNNTVFQQAVANLPATDPSGGAGFILSAPYERLLGLSTSTGNPDSTITLNTSFDWLYGQDVTNTIEHEVSESGMGRYGGLGDQQGTHWAPMDLFRYNATGVPDYSDGRDGLTTYFSYNGGITLSSNAGLSFNNEYNSSNTKVNSADVADFTQIDVFGAPRLDENTLSPTDIAIIDALGWNPSSNSNLISPTSVSAISDNHTNYASTGHAVTITVTLGEAVTVAGAPTLQLNDNEVATYSGGSGTNTLTFSYVVQTADNTSDLQVTGLNLPRGAAITDQSGNELSGNVTGDLGILINNAINDSITKLYVGYYNRAPDPSGETYWAGQLQGGMPLTQIAQSYSVQTESTNLYAFLASPNTASTAAVQAFITAVYGNLFNRAPDTAGENYWVGQLQTGQSTVGGAIINIISGAQLNDLVIINNKVTVGDYFDTQIFNNNVQFSASVASAALAAVTSSASSVTTAEAIVDTYVKTAPAASQAATGLQAEVNVVGVSPSHDVAIAVSSASL